MKSYSSAEIIKLLRADGWVLKSVSGDHYQFVHPIKFGKTTVPHPKKDLIKRVIASIAKQSGLNL